MLAGRAAPGRVSTRRRVRAVARLGVVLGGAAALWRADRGGCRPIEREQASGVRRMGAIVEVPGAMAAAGRRSGRRVAPAQRPEHGTLPAAVNGLRDDGLGDAEPLARLVRQGSSAGDRPTAVAP